MSKRAISLKDWDDTTALQAADAVSGLVNHPGWHYLTDALDHYEKAEHKQLLSLPPTDNGAAYADRVGQLKGLRKAREVAHNILENGRAIEEMDRKDENNG